MVAITTLLQHLKIKIHDVYPQITMPENLLKIVSVDPEITGLEVITNMWQINKDITAAKYIDCRPVYHAC